MLNNRTVLNACSSVILSLDVDHGEDNAEDFTTSPGFGLAIEEAAEPTKSACIFCPQPTSSKLSRPCSIDMARAWRSHRRLCRRFSDEPVPCRFVPESSWNLKAKLTGVVDLIAACGEATAQPFFINRLRNRMLSHLTGRRILRDRPRITSTTLSLTYLRTLPPNSVGRTYAAWLDKEGVSPDTRDNVRYIDDEECAYVMQRYRECHDFYHAVTGLPTMIEGEIAVKALEFANLGLPMTGLSLAAIVRLKPAERERFWSIYLPWAVRSGLKSESLINVYWEELLEKDVAELRNELGIEQPPDLRAIRKKEREARKREKDAKAAAA